jgi:hypothetical protein
MSSTDAAFLLTDTGTRVGLDSAVPEEHSTLNAHPEIVDHAIGRHGCVFICPVHRAIFVVLDPSRVAPLAAMEAFYQIKAMGALECVVLAYPGDGWKHPWYELFSSRGAALEKIEQVAHAASRRVAGRLQTRTLALCEQPRAGPMTGMAEVTVFRSYNGRTDKMHK